MRRRWMLVASWLGLYGLFCAGCAGWKWTDFEYVNSSGGRIYVEVEGVHPDPSPGNMAANTEGKGTTAGSHFGDVVTFDDTIGIISSVEGGEQRRQDFSREELGIPARVSGGKITFTYTAEGQWRVEFSR